MAITTLHSKVYLRSYGWNTNIIRLSLAYLAIPVEDALWDCRCSFFFFFLLFFFFFPPRFCLAHISGTVTRRDSKLSVLLGPAV